MLRSGIWEESKKPKSCLTAKRYAGELVSLRQPRLLLLTAINLLTSGLKSPENNPISRKILRGWRMAMGAFGRELVKLEAAEVDVRTAGELV